MLRAIGYAVAWFLILAAGAVGFVVCFAVGGEVLNAFDWPQWAQILVAIIVGLVGGCMAAGWLADGILPGSPRGLPRGHVNPYPYGSADYRAWNKTTGADE